MGAFEYRQAQGVIAIFAFTLIKTDKTLMPILDSIELEEILTEAVARLRAALSPLAIYLYGSYAYGIPQSHSDIDLLIVIPDNELTTFARDAMAIRALGDLHVPIEVQVYTQSEFESRLARGMCFERTVQQKGKFLHAA